MGNAEQGGLGSQHVLLIGGPKHGDLINLAEGQVEYEFTSMKTLLRNGESRWPDSSTHLYRLDKKLSPFTTESMRQGWAYTRHVNIFTHEVLWNSPEQGGFNLWALSDALSEVEKANVACKEARTREVKFADKLTALSESYEKALDLVHSQEHQLQKIRQSLELALQGVGAGIEATGRDYESVWVSSKEEV